MSVTSLVPFPGITLGAIGTSELPLKIIAYEALLLSRKELYEKVWNEPIIEFCNHFNALKKTSRRFAED
jgi:hypothetical protein